ncbi:hypothetical protein [Armatimonas sp.]|uniref:hypothetical protein n=1 Tax=Armatimonas sp. TaxID=1872638 RepID=UPI00286C573F|nr:hypothetical protein [Armatimonas sp.]
MRVQECTIREILKHEKIRLSVTGLRERELLLSSFRASLYPLEQQIPFIPAACSRLGLDILHNTILSSYFSAWQNFGIANIPKKYRIATKFLKLIDTRACFPADSFDIFQALSCGLPPSELTGKTPRSLWAYDLICIRNPEWVSAAALFTQQQTLVNFNREKDFIVCNAEYVRQDLCLERY